MSKEVLPFLTITENLTTNRCWLCEQTFPRGFTCNVFQIQNLLEYFQQRYKQECESNSSNAEACTSNPEGEAAQSPCPPMRTKNFSDCYQRYKNEMNTHGNIEGLLKELIENDLDVWMSGLICALHGGCAADASLFMGMDSTASADAKKKAGIPAGITFASCPPDCGCDNPAFLSA